MPDSKIINSGTFIIPNEDDTFGSIIRSQLLKNPDVLFSKYKLSNNGGIELKIQTNKNNPISALETALDIINSQTYSIEKMFEEELRRFERRRNCY